jgi:hypothetical protein
MAEVAYAAFPESQWVTIEGKNMKEFKGTPGPWMDEGVYIGSVHWPFQVAEVAKFFGHEALDECNAKLIAAAPELLEALQRMVNKAHKQNWNDAYPEELQSAHAAIKKALGEKQ